MSLWMFSCLPGTCLSTYLRLSRLPVKNQSMKNRSLEKCFVTQLKNGYQMEFIEKGSNCDRGLTWMLTFSIISNMDSSVIAGQQWSVCPLLIGRPLADPVQSELCSSSPACRLCTCWTVVGLNPPAGTHHVPNAINTCAGTQPAWTP